MIQFFVVLRAHWFGVLVLNLLEIASQSNSVGNTMIFSVFLGFSVKDGLSAGVFLVISLC